MSTGISFNYTPHSGSSNGFINNFKQSGGGLLQIVAYGSENIPINGNPQITFYKAMYKRYTNFSLESIVIPLFSNTNLSWDNPTIIRTTVPRDYADLLGGLYLTLDIPNIFSTEQDKFEWCDNLGTSMLDYISVFIGGQLIEKLTGDQIHINSKLSLTNEQLRGYSKLTANLSQLQFPQLNSEGVYPGYNVGPINNNTTSKWFNTIPTISARKIYIPLPFFFSNEIGCALPLISVLYQDIDIEIQLKPIKDLYTVLIPENYSFDILRKQPTIPHTDLPLNISSDILKEISYVRQAPTLAYHISKYIYPPEVVANRTWNLNPVLYGQFIFLDEEERKVFASKPQEYLIQQHYLFNVNERVGPLRLDIEAYHPVKEVYVVTRRTDVWNTNQWTNFTNFDYEVEDGKLFYQYNNYWWQLANNYFGYYIYCMNSTLTNFSGPVSPAPTNPFGLWSLLFGPFGLASLGGGVILSTDPTSPFLGNTIHIKIPAAERYTRNQVLEFRNIWRFRSLAPGYIPVITSDNYEFYTYSCIYDINIQFDGFYREQDKPAEYWEIVQPFMYHTNFGARGVNIYSFSLKPDEFQPSGACNFSRIKDVYFYINAKTPPLVNNQYIYRYDFYYYQNYYNILQFQGGLAGLRFSN